MRRYDAPPVHLLEQPRIAMPDQPRHYHTYQAPGGAGSATEPESHISLLSWPSDFRRPWGAEDEFERHQLHEEIFVLTGALVFGPWYRVDALGYFNHPPFWPHVTAHGPDPSAGLVTLLYRGGMPANVQFEKIPADWDGRPMPTPPTKSLGTRDLQLDDIAWFALTRRDGLATGLEAKRIAEDRDDGWTTWLMRAPPGWSAAAEPLTAEGGDEIYVIEGDLTLGRRQGATLTTSGYVCDSKQIAEGAGTLSSRDGALFVRWTKHAERIWRVAPQP
jgi:hypothetical protein